MGGVIWPVPMLRENRQSWSAKPFLAGDSTGLVIVDASNPSQPKEVSQTTLESYNPFPFQGDEGPRSVALSVGLKNGLVYVGTANSLSLVFGYDYSQPAYPRLVSMNYKRRSENRPHYAAGAA